MARLTRRRLATAALALSLLLAGCSGGGTGTPVVATGPTASVDAATLNATGYAPAGRHAPTLTVTVSVEISGDVRLTGRQAVNATTPVSTYRRDTSAGPAVFAVAGAPAVRPIENQAIYRNPLAAVSVERLVGHVQSTHDVSGLRERANRSVRMLGIDTFAVTHHGRADGSPIAVTVASVRRGEQFVTAVAVTPRSASDFERVRRLLAGVTRG